jgi:hypothetical protein
MRQYRAYGFKRFHSMNAAVKDCTQSTFFASYYTLCLYWNKRNNTLHVSPFIYDKDAYINSQTTNKQCNRWLRETLNDYGLTVQFLRDVYEQNDAKERAFYSYNNMRIKFDNVQFHVGDFMTR